MGFLGIVSLITAYSLFTKRAWAPWLVFIMLVTITVFSGVTLYSVGFSNLLVTAIDAALSGARLGIHGTAATQKKRLS